MLHKKNREGLKEINSQKSYSTAQKQVTSRVSLPARHGAIVTSRQTREKLQCLYENLMSNNFRKTAVLEKISVVN